MSPETQPSALRSRGCPHNLRNLLQVYVETRRGDSVSRPKHALYAATCDSPNNLRNLLQDYVETRRGDSVSRPKHALYAATCDSPNNLRNLPLRRNP